jgi:hypothetical protein
MANQFKLSGHGIALAYTVGGGPSLPALTLTDNGVTRSYTPSEITTDQTDLGMMVSVPLIEATDRGGARFGFFLPAVRVLPGQRVAVTTSGVIQTYSGSKNAAHSPSTWSCVHLHGTASQSIAPLVAAAA